MATLAMSFDAIEYSRQLRKAGVSQEQADVQAQTMEKALNDVAKNSNLVTKQDLAELKLELVKWMLGIGVTGILAIAGLLKYIH